MNSKKGKKKSKPHPTPIVASNKEEKKEIHEEVQQLENTAEKECTVETIGEVVLAEVKSEDAAPKKPKRNRGKNKKQDKEEALSDEHKQREVEKDLCDTLTTADLVSVSNLVFKTDDKDNLDSSNNKCEECETVTPTTRKKKNKKKDNKTNIENLSKSQPTSALKENEPSKIEENITEPLKLSEAENLMKSNKKNKKKNRLDSGASDKVQEISCATAFQPPTEGVDEKSISVLVQDSSQNENISVKETNTTDYFRKISETDDAQEVLQKSNEEIDTFKEEAILTEESSKHEIQESKLPLKNNNKKINKDDIQQKIEAYFDDNKDQEKILKLPPIKTEESKNLAEETLSDSLATSIESTHLDVRDTDIKVIHKNNKSAGSPIVKAIIAKPVEKIKKGKKDRHEVENKEVEIFDSENNMNKASQEETITEKNNIINVEDSESKGNTVPQDIKSQDCQHVGEHLTLSQEVEVIKIPDSAMGKKRKKSPKFPRVVIPEPAASKEEILHFKKGDKQAPETTTTIPINSEKAVIETQTEIISQIERNINSSDISKNAPEPKSRRKGKKSQKAPLTPGVTDFIPTFGMESKTPFVEFEAYLPEKTEEHKILSPEITTYNILEPLTVGQENKYDEKDITDIPFIDTEVNSNISTVSITRENDPIESLKSEEKPAEVNESSIVTDSCKTEVETPTLDIIPDIHYPRSTSQGYDGNNNTVIQEMRPDELQLPSVKDSPVIQGSGETPIGTPEMIISDIVISEVPKTENLMEKTDLKSKMLEVNRDMEELRMSIERSLAGFTSLETSEERIEKKYEDKIKIDTEERDISKNSTEKSDVAIDKDVKQSLVTSELITDDANKTKTLSTLDKQPSSKKEDTETIHSVEEFSEKININETINKRDDDPEKNTEEVLPVSGENIEQKTEHVDKKQDTKCSDPNQPIHPPRKDNKGKNKKRKGKQEAAQSVETTQSNSEIKNVSKENSNKKEEKCEKTEHSTSNSQEKSKQQADTELPETKEESPNIDNEFVDSTFNIDFEPIENFEDALTSSTEVADINKSFDMIVNETNIEIQQKLAANKPEIKIIGPDEKPKEKVTPPKNLLGHPDIPVPSNRTDYKKEKNKTPNTKQAKVKIKDSVEIELPENYKTDKENTELPETVNNELKNQKSDIFDNQNKGINSVTYSKAQNDIKENGQHQHAEKPETVLIKNEPSKSFTVESNDDINANKKLIKTENVENRKQSTQSQTENRKSKKNIKNKDSLTQLKENEEFVYKYSFRKVFLQNACNVCKKELKLRVACNFCNLLFYCSNKHKDEDWPQHQALCFAISTIGHMKDQKYIYADTKNITGQNYRLVRMQMILSCEKVLKRRLVPWEQELLLYPRICAEASCRQWKQTKLKDCEGCGQISYCMDKPEHLPKTHQRWCKSYSLYQKLVIHQQTKGRLEPKMPTKVMAEPYQIPDKINEVLASIYEEKIDMNDVQYAALTQLATAPLTAAYAHQVYANKVSPTTNGITKKPIFTIHVVGAELQFEADALNKWEVFFLHVRPDVQELKVVLISTDLNPSNLPLDLLAKIKHCENCRTNKRRVTFSFQDKKKYAEYRSSMDYCYPDLICAFNPSIQRSSVYKDLDTWPSTLNTVLRSKVPFVITAYSIAELLRDLIRVKECVEIDYKVMSEAKYNSFASVRPDRNFITDDEMPLLFKNYCFMVICGC